MFLRYTRCLLVLLALLLLLFIGLTFLSSDASSESVKGVEQWSKRELIEEECTEGSEGRRCLQVADRVLTLPQRGVEYVERTLYEEVRGERATISRAALQAPHNATFSESDTRLWAVDHSLLLSQYEKAILALLYMTNSIKMQHRAEKKRFLFLGIRSASLSSLLRTLKHKAERVTVEEDARTTSMMKKWFEWNSTRLVQQKPEEWLGEESGKEQPFDVVVVDVCGRNKTQLCPVPSLTTESAFHSLHALLHKEQRATLFLNVIMHHVDQQRLLEGYIDSLLSLFPQCVSMSMQAETSMIVACATTPFPFYEQTQPAKSQRETMDHMMEVYEDVREEMNYGLVGAQLALHVLQDKKRATLVNTDKIDT